MHIPKIVDQNIRFYLSDNYNIENEDQTKVIAKSAFAHLKNQTHLSAKEIEAKVLSDPSSLTQAVDEIIASGKTPWVPHVEFKDKRQEMLFHMMRGNIPKLKELSADRKLLPAVLWKKNLSILGDTRGLLNDIFVDMFQQMEGKNLSKQESFHMEAMIGDLLALYPFLRPVQGEELKVPVQINGEWKLISYETDKILLTPSWMGSPLVAYGLTSKKTPDAPPLLLFKGTTYPTDEGASLSILTDLNPGASVGAYAYKIGKKKIASWLQTHTTPEKKAVIFGKSLGGAHAWRTALQFPNYVAKSMCIAAPGFSSRDLAKLKSLKKKGELPEINIFSQKNDPVQYIDHIAKEGVNYFQVLGKKSKRGGLAHAHMDSTQEQSVILNKKPAEKSMKRVALSGLKVLSSLTLFPLLVIPHAGVSLVKRIRSK